MTDPLHPTNGVTLTGWGATLRIWGREVLIVVALLLIAGQMTLDRRDRVAEHQAIATASQDLACMLAVPAEPRHLRLEAATDPRGACHYITTVYRFQPLPREGSR